MSTTLSPSKSTKPPKAKPRSREGVAPLGAELWLKQHRPLRCEVSKLAHNSLVFVSLHELSEALQDTPNATPGRLLILGDGNATPLSIPVRVNHHTRERWVLEPQPGALNLLVKLKTLLQAPPENSESSSERLTPFRRSELFSECQQILHDFLQTRFAGFFSELDDRLLRAAATDRPGQESYQQAIATASEKQQGFESDYCKRVLESLNAAAQPDFIPAEVDFTADRGAGRPASIWFQLSKQANTGQQNTLDMLALHFSMVVRQLCEPVVLPFGPAWLYRHFADTVAAMPFPEPTHQLLGQVFRDTVISHIGPLYARLEASFSTRNSARAAQHNLPPVLQRTASGVAESKATSPAAQTEIVLPNPTPNSASSLLRAAAQLQQLSTAASGRTGASTTPEINAIAAEVLSGEFDLLVASELMHEDARPLLRQIKVPVLTLARSEPTFLETRDHPARRCWSLITMLCREIWFRGGPVRRRLPSICERIQREWKVNQGVFAAVLPLLEEISNRQQPASERNAQRVAAKQEGQHRLKQAQNSVSTQLRQRFEGLPFPIELQQLIDHGWHQYMVHLLLNQGQRSDTFQQCLQQLEHLHHALLPETPGRRPAPGDFSAERISEQLLKPLESIGLASAQYQQTLGRLEQLLRNPDVKPAMATDFRAQSSSPQHKQGAELGETTTAAAAADEIPTLSPATFDQPTAAGQEGDGGLPLNREEWLGWIDCPGEQPMQLAWIAPDESQYTFVDQAGSHLFDLSETELAADRRLGLQRMANPWQCDPLEDILYQALARRFSALSMRPEDSASPALDANAFESRLAELARFATYSGQSHVLIGLAGAKSSMAVSHDSSAQLPTHGGNSGASLIGDICPPEAIIGHLGAAGPGSTAHSPNAAGGDSNYAVLLPYTDGESGQLLAQQLQDALLASAGANTAASTEKRVALLMVTPRSSPPSTLLNQLRERCAPSRLSAGGDTSASGSTPLSDTGSSREFPTSSHSWVPRLGRILQQDRLRLRLQGSVATGAAQQNHYEILLGVIDDNGRISLPGELITAAEQHQRMDIIDRWIIQHTFQWLQEHPEKIRQLGCIHINLSGNALQSKPFLAFLMTELDRGKLPNQAIGFEISETTASANLPRAADFIARVRSTGCHFALDNFGKGAGSLELLRILPVNMVKFDRSYCRGLSADTRSYPLLNALASAARSLGIATCAQGVENEAILQSLETLGIDYAQGFGVSKPVLLDEA